MNFKRKRLIFDQKWKFVFLCFSLILLSCKKKKVEPVLPSPDLLENGMLVLNEGLFQQNNASLSFVNFNSTSVDKLFFENKTSRPLGDTGNDIQLYDGKLFIVVNVSSTLEILDAKTGNPIKQLKMVQNGVPKQPRYIAFHADKAYVSCYDGFVDVIDLSSLTITKRIPVGSNPEQLAVSNAKLYVSNSGGLSFPNVDSTVSVISLTNELEIKKITVGANPGPLVVDKEGDVYVVSRGDFATIPSRMHRISSITDTKLESFSFDAQRLFKMNDALVVSYESANSTKFLQFDTQTETIVTTDFGDFEAIQTFYGMQFSSSRNKLYCFDAQGYVNTGYVLEYDKNGQFIRKFNVGLIPNQIVVYD